MNKSGILFAFATSLLMILTACGAQAPTQAATEVEQPVVVVEPTTQPLAVSQPTQPQYAPFCQAAAAGCSAPEIEVLDKAFCVNKWPYIIMKVPAGTTYEPVDADLICQDQLHSDGSLRITCNDVEGQQLLSYELKVCNSACSAPALATGTGQCPDGYGYDSGNQCCAQPSTSGGDGCVVYTVDIGACPDPQ